jgi:hypothetical protein
MDNNELLFIAVAALIFNALILYVVISAATKASKRARYEWAQMELLAKIARAQGVPEAEIKAIAGAIK